MEYTHWLKATGIPGSSWTKVTKDEWLAAESRAGFRPKPGCGPYATGGFSDSAGIRGSLTRDDQPPRS